MDQEHHNFMTAAYRVAQWSTTVGDKVGSVLVTPQVALIDRCELPEGVLPMNYRYGKPDWFLWSDHAERRVIYNAARYGIPTEGAIIYTTWFPCVECAKAISQCGIKRVVGREPDWNNERWNFLEARQVLEETKVEIIFYKEKKHGRIIDKTFAA